MDEKGLGARLQKMRRQAGMTQQQLCLAANLSFSTLTKIERGAIKAPSIFTIQSIADALGLSLDHLLGNKGPVEASKATRSGARCIFFDVNGCLLRFYHRAFTHIARDYNVPPDVAEMAYLHFNDEACRGTLTLADFNQAVASRLGITSFDWAKYYLESVEPMPGMAAVVAEAATHYKVGLLTNIMQGLLPALLKQGTIPAVSYDLIVDSSSCGLIKPEPAIYKLAADRIGLPPEQLLLIDDTKENVVAAEALGWNVLWFDFAQPKESVEQVLLALQPAES